MPSWFILVVTLRHRPACSLKQMLADLLPLMREGLWDSCDALQAATLQGLAVVVGWNPDVMGQGRRVIFSESLQVLIYVARVCI